MCELIILPLLSTLVNHTKTILVQNLVFCMIPRDSGMQCSGFVIPLMCRILNRGLGYGTTSGCTRRWPPQWKNLSSALAYGEALCCHTLVNFAQETPLLLPHSTPHSELFCSAVFAPPQMRRKKHLAVCNSSPRWFGHHTFL